MFEGDRNDRYVTFVKPVYVGGRVVGFVVDESAGEPIERFACRGVVFGKFFGPISGCGTRNFHALWSASGRDVDVEAYAFRKSAFENFARDLVDIVPAFAEVGVACVVEQRESYSRNTDGACFEHGTHGAGIEHAVACV